MEKTNWEPNPKKKKKKNVFWGTNRKYLEIKKGDQIKNMIFCYCKIVIKPYKYYQQINNVITWTKSSKKCGQKSTPLVCK